MEDISRIRAFSSPELRASTSQTRQAHEYTLEGIATSVKVLLKLVQEHNEAGTKYQDDRKVQRIAGMMSILDDVKSRIEKSQSGRKRMAELRRCNTDLRAGCAPRDKKPQEQVTDEKERLKKQLNASLAARKSLEIMCSSLGKEKEIMSMELARKVHELAEMEELVNDLKTQNGTLLAKLQSHVADQKEKKGSGEEAQGNIALQDRNKELSEKLLKSLDGYRSLKRKYKDLKEKNIGLQTTMEEIGEQVEARLERICSFRQKLSASDDHRVDIEKEISALEKMFERFDMMISKHVGKSVECAKQKAEMNTTKPIVLAWQG